MWINRGKKFEDLFKDVSTPLQMSIPDIDKAAAMFVKACLEGRLRVVGDYDCDGLTSLANLKLLAYEINPTPKRYAMTFRVPMRFSEGYGLSDKIIDEIIELDEGYDGYKLCITIDNGITAVEQVKRLKENGYEVLILDHHEMAEDKIIPDADVVIDPEAFQNASFNYFCGAGLSLALAKYIDENVRTLSPEVYNTIKVYAAFGTVADCMPLVEENATLVKTGLAIAQTKDEPKTAGCAQLLVSTYTNKFCTEYDVAFTIGPEFNASSRVMEKEAIKFLRLITAREMTPTTVENAEYFVELNKTRKALSKELVARAEKIIDEYCYYTEVPLIINIPDAKEGLIGIVAGRLCEKYNCPVLVMSPTEDGTVLKGSGRAPKNFNLKELMDNHKELFVRYGGHAAACGFSIEADSLDQFREELQTDEMCTTYEPIATADIEYDLEVPFAELDTLLKAMEVNGPWGEGHERPVVRINGFLLSPKGGSYEGLTGENGEHLKLYGPNNMIFIGFNMADKYHTYKNPTKIDVIGTFNPYHYQYSKELFWQCEILDFERTEATPVSALRAKLNSIAKAK